MISRIADVLNNRFMRCTLVSQLFLQIGIWVRNVAILVYVMKQTDGDPFAISLISVAEYAPICLMSFIGGVYADHWRPKRTMICCDLLSALSVFIVLLTLYMGTWKVVFFATFASAILSQFSQPCGLKLFKIHLSDEQMRTAISIYQTIGAVFLIFGPVLGMIVYQTFGIVVAIAVMGFAFLLSAGVLTYLPPDKKAAAEKERSTLGRELLNGLRYILSKNLLTSLGFCFIAIGFGLGLIQPLGIFLVTERLGLPMEKIQWFMAVGGVGLILGGLIAIVYLKTVLPQRLLMFGMIVCAASIATAGFSRIFWLTLCVHFFSSVVIPLINIGISTMIMQNTEEAYVGRVNGILTPLYTGSVVVTMAISGLLKHLLSLVVIYELSALFFLVGVIFIIPIYSVQKQEEPA